MGVSLVTPPSGYPVTLAEAKENSRVTSDTEDGLIEGLIAAATGYVERFTDLAIGTRTWMLALDAFSDSIELPRGPVQSVGSVKYYAPDGVLMTLSTDVYTVDLTSYRQWIVRNSAESWPAILDGINAVQVTYDAGLVEGDLGYAEVQQAIKLLVSHWYHNREAVSAGNAATELPMGVQALLLPLRRIVI